MRLFTAIPIPLELRGCFATLQDAIMGHALSGKAERPENLHVTLNFLGEVDEARVPEVAAIMDGVSAVAFGLEFGHVGRFTQKRIKIDAGRAVMQLWWVAPNKNQQLEDVFEQLDGRLVEAGFETPDRVFTPHVTLARKVVLAGGDKQTRDHSVTAALELARQKRMPEGVDTSRLAWPSPLEDTFVVPVDGISLMQSEFTPHGMRYHELHRTSWA